MLACKRLLDASLSGLVPTAYQQGFFMDLRQVIDRFFGEQGIKHTLQRDAIVSEFLAVKEHISIDDLLARVRTQHPKVGYATVYRTLSLLKEAGVADERHFGDGKALYEPMSEHHHDHLICTVCGKIVEFENRQIEAQQDEVARAHGFKIS